MKGSDAGMEEKKKLMQEYLKAGSSVAIADELATAQLSGDNTRYLKAYNEMLKEQMQMLQDKWKRFLEMKKGSKTV